MSTPAVPSADVSLGTKLDIMWKNNKPLFIGLVVLISLIFLAIIFVIVYFLVIRPRQNAGADQAAIQTAKHLYQGLRAISQ